MPTLEWIGKDKVINHHLAVPFRVLDRKYSYDETGQHAEDNGSENMIIKGDNLEALKALLPRYEGKIKCIYIDPPYNTGNEKWVYNDNVNDPKIKKWLGEVVGTEGEDLSRHDKWLCMMYPRLRLLQRLLREDGCLVISISYHELQNLVALCKEIFAAMQVVVVTVQTSGGKPSGGFNYVHEYLVFIVPFDFQANALDFCGGNARTPFEGLTLSTFDKTQRPNQVYPIFITENGTFGGTGKSLQEQIDDGSYKGEKKDFPYDYSIAPPGMVAIWPITAKGKQCVWRQIPGRLKRDWTHGYIKISPNKGSGNENLYSIQYLPSGVIKKINRGELEILGTEEGVPTLRFGLNRTVGGQIPSIWAEKAFFTVNGTQMLKEIFPETEKKFDYPKPVPLIQNVIKALSQPGDIILDSFAGSGTTAHAVLDLNQEAENNRTFIVVEMEAYAESTTAERVKRVIKGYSDKPGTGGNFSFYELGEPLLVGENLNESVGVEKIREYVWFMETKQPFSEPQNPDNAAYLGNFADTAYYFHYEKERATTLDHDFLSTIQNSAPGFVIYADLNTLSEEELKEFSITFKKIPRDIAKL